MQPSPLGLSVSYIFNWTPGREVNQWPSPLGRGWTTTAFSPAVAGRVRGYFAQFRESTSSATPRSSIAVQSNSTPQPGFAGETGDGTCGKAAGQLHLTLRARA